MNQPRTYFSELAEGIGGHWNRFWFRGVDPFPLAVLRIAVGLVAFWYFATFTFDLVRWFGPFGILPNAVVREITGAADAAMALGPQQGVYRFSLLQLGDSPAYLWTIHLAGLASALLLTIGCWTRWANLLTLVILLSYVHRGPMLTGQLEPILSMLLLYLCIGPSGVAFSVDHRRARRRAGDSDRGATRSVAANISLRLIQIHLVGFYLVMGLSKLGSEVWWVGEAVWLLIASSHSRLVDLTFLNDSPYVLNLWTHAIVLFELSYAVLIWNRLARPLLIVASIIIWGSLAIVTGLLAYCALMVMANTAFIPAESLRDFFERRKASQSAIAT